MSKIFILFMNENTKTWKKFSTKLVIIIAILALFGALGLAKVVEYINSRYDSTFTTDNFKESTELEMKNLKETLEDPQISESEKEINKIQIEMCELELKYDASRYDESYWKGEILSRISELKILKEDEAQIANLISIIEQDDYSKYMDIKKQEEKQKLENEEITKEEYEDNIFILDLKAQNNIGKNKNEGYWRNALISQIQLCKRSLRAGIDYNSAQQKLLSSERRQELEDTIKINVYRLQNDIPPVDYAEENYRMFFETLAQMFTIAVIAIFAIMLAGGAISNEISTGTIKFWALTPNKRWKILTAKILSILYYLVVITLIISILTIVTANIFFNNNGIEYLYVKDGNVEKIGNVLYTIETYFAKLIPIVLFVLFALMLSTITRNTAAAVSFGIATYMGNGIVMTIINNYIKKDWIRFVPFNNLNIVEKIFPNIENPMQIMGESFATDTSLWFSLAVLGVCAILMLVTMYDSFNNRDIV